MGICYTTNAVYPGGEERHSGAEPPANQGESWTRMQFWRALLTKKKVPKGAVQPVEERKEDDRILPSDINQSILSMREAHLRGLQEISIHPDLPMTHEEQIKMIEQFQVVIERSLMDGGPIAEVEDEQQEVADHEKQTTKAPPTLMHSSSVPMDDAVTMMKLSRKMSFLFRRGNVIGAGSFGVVYQGLSMNTGQILAIKNIRVEDPEVLGYSMSKWREQVEYFKTFDHPNLIKYYSVEPSEDEAGIDIFMEFLAGGSLLALLGTYKKFVEGIVSLNTRQILEALAFLHANQIVHGHLTSTNVVCDQNGTKKLTDYWGYDFLRAESESIAHTQEGSHEQRKAIYFTAPEILEHSDVITSAVDIWSLGCIVIEMLSAEPPWYQMAKSKHELLEIIRSGDAPQTPTGITAKCADFIRLTMNSNPLERPTAVELLEHPFIKNPPMAESNNSYAQNELVRIGQLSNIGETSPMPGEPAGAPRFFRDRSRSREENLPGLPSIKAIEVPITIGEVGVHEEEDQRSLQLEKEAEAARALMMMAEAEEKRKQQEQIQKRQAAMANLCDFLANKRKAATKSDEPAGSPAKVGE